MIDYKDYDLLTHNTFGISARCRRFVELSTVEEAIEVLPSIGNEPFIIIGAGSNLLLTKNYDGTVLHSAIRGINVEIKDMDVLVRCGSGETWDDVVEYCVGQNIFGAENLSLIPGDVGASAVQNIGAYGMEIKDILESIEAVEIATGKLVHFANAECGYAYRLSRFKQEWKNRFFITHVTYRLTCVFTPKLDYGNIRKALADRGLTSPSAWQMRDTIIAIREEKLPDPKVLGNAGSFFMNPIVSREKFESLLSEYPDIPHYEVDDWFVKIPAGWMIDRCGWKGRTIGNAGVHDKQALVLINRGGASGEEIVTLCRMIQKDVLEKFGIEIRPEVNII